MSTETKDAKGGWRDLQNRRREALLGFDEEARQLIQRMLGSIPESLTVAAHFDELFVDAMRQAWQTWQEESPLVPTDFVIDVYFHGRDRVNAFCRTTAALQAAWSEYATLKVRKRAFPKDAFHVIITLK